MTGPVPSSPPVTAPTPAGRPVTFRAATADEREGWDDLTVHVGGGHVYQSRAWATHRAATGWRPSFLVGSDGSGVLALGRRWPVIGGASAYIPRGPVPAGGAPAMAARLLGATDWLASHGVDVLATDAEIPADTGYGALIAAGAFRPIPEIQPSRHRMSLDLGGQPDEAALRSACSKSTRQRIASAEQEHLEIVRHDTRKIPADGLVSDAPGPPSDALAAFSRLLAATGDRVGFRIGDMGGFIAWWMAAHAAGHVIYLEARAVGGPVGGLILYRHGGRLSTVHSADDPASRRTYPGLMHLLRWRAIQLALREGCAEMDLGGVDVAPDHGEPVPGSPTYGLYEHKRSFGARWISMSGAHERVIRPWRSSAGRVTARVARAVRR